VEGAGPDFLLLVVFHERKGSEGPPPRLAAGASGSPQGGVVRHLEEELDLMRSNLRDTVEQYEASTEELKASNEEFQAMNEELRSATEELETGREELQSINEEIVAINQELKSKVEELSRANSDLQNLMASTNIATIFLDRKLRIALYTPSTAALFNCISSDIGRPLSDLTHRLEYPQITADADRVLESLAVVEREVRDAGGHWFLARMFPYRTTDDVIAGVVITLVDITERKHAEDVLRWLSAIVESANDSIVSFDMDGVIVSWNRGAERVFGYRADEAVGRQQDFFVPAEMRDQARGMLETLRRGEAVPPCDSLRQRKDGTLIDVTLSASLLKNVAGEAVGFTVIALDISERRRADDEIRQAREGLELRVVQRTSELSQRIGQLAQLSSDLTLIEQRERDRVARILHDELQQLLVGAKMKLEECGDAAGAPVSIDCEGARNRAISLIDEALESSRSLAVELSPPILAEGLGVALEWLCGTWMKKTHNLAVEMDIDTRQDVRSEDMRVLGFLAVRELLFNIVKHARVREAKVRLRAAGGMLEITVQDDGSGFDPDLLHTGGGSGFGLAGLRERLELLGGGLELNARPGHGVVATVRVPRKLSEEDENSEIS
jgi:two-component system CheB/CheR fusion protein